MRIALCLLVWISIIGEYLARKCIPRQYSEDSIVCVCNATYCDDGMIIPDQLLKNQDSYLHYMSSDYGERLTRISPANFKRKHIRLSPYDNTTATFKIDTTKKYQEIYGFGGAITDSVGINLASLTNETQIMLMRQYFGAEGNSYTFIRIPIGGTDFSTHNYTYDDVDNDTNLTHFQLAGEDYKYKIHYTKLAQSISSRQIKIITSPWSCPEWMKELRFPIRGHSRLQKTYYQLYADYIIKFLDEYKKHDIYFWGISPQNEPHDGVFLYYGFNSLGWMPNELTLWMRDYFIPTLHANGYRDVKILMLDDARRIMLSWAVQTLSDDQMKQFISGIAIHWYEDETAMSPASLLRDTHYVFPDKFLLYTEASFSHSPVRDAVLLGNWERAELYAHNIIEDLNNWVVGWIDWNLVLNINGGPTWVGNTLDAAIIVNATADEFYKQPMFYTLAHFSKFIPPGSYHIELKTTSDDNRGIENIAFLREDNHVVVVLMNRDNMDKEVIISDENKGQLLLRIPAHSIHTLLYKNEMKNVHSSTGSINKMTVLLLNLSIIVNVML